MELKILDFVSRAAEEGNIETLKLVKHIVEHGIAICEKVETAKAYTEIAETKYNRPYRNGIQKVDRR